MVEKTAFIDQTLNRIHPAPRPFLLFKTPYQLLVAVILSAQCTDVRVNMITKKLFSAAPGPREMQALGLKGLIRYIRSSGYYNAKAKHILETTNILLSRFHGEVPSDFHTLVTFPGVGEKTAGVVTSQAFGTPAFPVDTHVYRVARRLGLSKEKSPNKVSRDLQRIFPKRRWKNLTMQMILHGRTLCTARKPKCDQCPLLQVCQYDRLHEAIS